MLKTPQRRTLIEQKEKLVLMSRDVVRPIITGQEDQSRRGRARAGASKVPIGKVRRGTEKDGVLGNQKGKKHTGGERRNCERPGCIRAVPIGGSTHCCSMCRILHMAGNTEVVHTDYCDEQFHKEQSDKETEHIPSPDESPTKSQGAVEVSESPRVPESQDQKPKPKIQT